MGGRIVSLARVVTSTITAYVNGTMEPMSVDAQGNQRVTVVDSGGSSVGRLSSGATQIPLVVAEPLEWAIVSAPAANTIASATKAAGGAGIRHVLRSLVANVQLVTAASFTAAAPVYWVVRDGASGAGAILYQGLSTAATLSGLNIMGSPNVAMTVEYTVAPGATNFEVISASGYSIALT